MPWACPVGHAAAGLRRLGPARRQRLVWQLALVGPGIEAWRHLCVDVLVCVCVSMCTNMCMDRGMDMRKDMGMDMDMDLEMCMTSLSHEDGGVRPVGTQTRVYACVQTCV